MSATKNHSFSTLENALRVLKCFSMEEPELSFNDLIKKLKVSKSTLHRLLITLQSEGFVHKDHKSNLYSLGTSVLSLTNTVTSQLRIIKEANPILKELTEKVGESSHIGIIEGNDVIYLQKVECDFPVKLPSHLGKRNPIHCTSCGQVLLAFQKENFIEDILSKGLKKYTKNTIIDPNKLREKLKLIQKHGYSVTEEEFHEGIISIAAPIYNAKNHVIASIDIAGSIERVSNSKSQIINSIIDASNSLSKLIIART